MDAALNLSTPSHPFRDHLVALLSIYEHGSFPGSTIPQYEGPTDQQTESILKSLGAMAYRMHSAEDTVGYVRNQLDLKTIYKEFCQENFTSVEEEISSPPPPNMTRKISLDSLSLPSFNDPDPNSMEVHDCPVVIPPGPAPMLAAGAFESDMSAVEELRLLKAQVSDIARVCNAVARGDLGQMITVPAQGVVMVQLKDVVNTMVDKLGQFAREIIRISKEDGTEGKLGGQAVVPDIEGAWQELIGIFNKLTANLTG